MNSELLLVLLHSYICQVSLWKEKHNSGHEYDSMVSIIKASTHKKANMETFA